MAVKRIQLCRSASGRPDERPILRGPFLCEVGNYSFGVVIVAARDDIGRKIRSIIETRSGWRIGRVITRRGTDEYQRAIDAMIADLIVKYGETEVLRRIQDAPTLAYMEAKT